MADLQECERCQDSGYVEYISGGIWTGESMSFRHEICDCLCGEDVRRELRGDPPPTMAIVGNRFWLRLMRRQMSKRAFRRYRGKDRARWKAVAYG